MNSKIKKIDSIKGMAVFQDFNWDKSVRHEGNNVAEFGKINILYGRNYSGKTTLSQIFRALEIRTIPEGYASPEFQLRLEDGSTVTQNSLNEHGHFIRVFNRSFVKDNLRFIVDGEKGINSFAVLGVDNTQVADAIGKCESDLEGLGKTHLNADKDYNTAYITHSKRDKELNRKLHEKATNKKTGIKYNKTYGLANYNVLRLKEDIKIVTKDSYAQPSDEQVQEYYDLLKTEPKDKINESASFGLKYSTIAFNAKELIQKKIQMSDPIQELLSNTALEEWVRVGRGLHEGERDKCAFCCNDLPEDLWKKLDKHFNQGSEELRDDLDIAVGDIESEKKRVSNLLKISNSDFYPKFTKRLNMLAEQFSAHSAAYCKNLESIKAQLEKRKNQIFTLLTFEAPASVEDDLNAIGSSYEELINDSNKYTDSLSADQSYAREALRLHVVFTFSTNINYTNEENDIERLGKEMETAEKLQIDAKANVDRKQAEISKLKDQLKDESKGADRVNYYLSNSFGHQFLSLKTNDVTSDGIPSKCQFEVIRNGVKAFHLSEGECSLIAFCYFMAKLEDIETKGRRPIIWIDDPVSSLDENHIFYVYSLINAKVAALEEHEDGESKKVQDHFKQLFISTHNLNFLRYLKQLPIKKAHKKFFVIERHDNESSIKPMPKHLKKYITEFNYLFEQLYKCATIKTIDDTNHTVFYNFGNNARKFLELYLYYKYPGQGKTEKTFQRFFGMDNISSILMDRINNEYSHLRGDLERGSAPVVEPEMKKAASFLLGKIEEKDPDQYSALLESIGVKKDPFDDELVTTK